MVDYLIAILEPLKRLSDGKSQASKNRLKEVYETHLRLKSFVDNSNECFTIINLFQIFQSASFMCISNYLFTTAAPGEDNTKTLFFAFAAASEPVLYCFVGQYLTDKF